MQGLIAGRLDYECRLLLIAALQIQSGSVKAIALFARVSDDAHVAGHSAGTGPADIDVSSWSAIFPTEGNTPPAIVQKLHVSRPRP
jgi:hypothetical protein